VQTLATGDYSVAGFEDRIAIERKTKEDAYSSLGWGRARFQREAERLGRLDFAAIVIEASLPDFLQPPAFSHLHPKAAISTLLAWSVRYRVHVFFAGDRRHGEALTRVLLETFWKCHQSEERVGREDDLGSLGRDQGEQGMFDVNGSSQGAAASERQGGIE
jgi:ERCC4-type nuclease